MAFVVLHPHKVEKWRNRDIDFEQDLKRHARSRLPGFAAPEYVQVVIELPVSLGLSVSIRVILTSAKKTSTGKILKAELRKAVAKL